MRAMPWLGLLASAPALAGAASLNVSTDDGLTLASMDGRYALELGGSLAFDAAGYQDDGVDLHSGTDLSRARLDLEGVVDFDWQWQLELDVADGTELDDVWIGREWDAWRARLGQFKPDFSLEEQTSLLDHTFMERSLANALVPDRAIGLGVDWGSDRGHLGAGVFGRDIDSDDSADDDADEGWGVGGRASWAVYDQGRDALHLGASLYTQWPDDAAEVELQSAPESHITDVDFVDTEEIDDVERIDRGGVEAAWTRGSLGLQAEWIEARLERDRNDDLAFRGGYAQASYFLTGDARRYRADNGDFAALDALPGRWGAWEVAARVSHLDLEEDALPGGEQRNVALALNWYASPRLRLSANYILVEADPPTRVEDSDYVDADGDAARERPRVFQLRGQLRF